MTQTKSSHGKYLDRLKFTLWRLRPLILLLLIIAAVQSTVQSWRSAGMHTYTIAIAKTDLNSGQVLKGEDVEYIDVYTSRALPEHFAFDPLGSEHSFESENTTGFTGFRASTNIRGGTLLSDTLKPRVELDMPDDYVQVSIRLSDRGVSTRLSPGDIIDLVAQDDTGRAFIAAEGIYVLENSEETSDTKISTHSLSEDVTLLGVPHKQALEILGLTQTHSLSALIVNN